MALIEYIGPHDEVSLDGVGLVKNGDFIDVPDELAKSLLEQTDNWAKSAKKSTSKNEES